MNAGIDAMIRRAYFISPVVDMEKLILNMMSRANVTETELEERGVIPTSFGENLSWDYLCYVRKNPVCWTVPTRILYGSRDNLTSCETMRSIMRDYIAYCGLDCETCEDQSGVSRNSCALLSSGYL